jgi:glutamate dehydrogenase (NAD(P)+)
MSESFAFADDLGPAKVVEIHEPALDLRAILVVDNVACGPAIGGVRMAHDADVAECFRLARAMTLKNAAADLPHGGGKSVIVADPAMPADRKEAMIRAFACAIGDIGDYIPGPDMGTDETCMAWVRDEIGRAVGLPAAIGGIPLDEIGATGFGVAVAGRVAADYCEVRLDGARVAVQGYGAVGRHAARFLARDGARLVAAADSHGTVFDADGLDLDALDALKAAGKSVVELPGAETGDAGSIVAAACDIWIPAARPDVLRADNVDRLQARLVLQGANIPATAAAESRMAARGILSVPDFVANAGGVICASVEYHGGTRAAAFAAIGEKIAANAEAVLAAARDENLLPRAAAERLARRRVVEAMGYRRWHR